MADRWFYAVGEERRGPVEQEELLRLIRDGKVDRATLVWTKALTDWTPAGGMPELADALGPVAAAPAGKDDAVAPPSPVRPPAAPKDTARRWLAAARGKLAGFADLPTISRMPVRQILVGGLSKPARAEDLEEALAVGTPTTTPPLIMIADGWPTPRIFWRVFGGALAAVLLLRVGAAELPASNLVAGLTAVGAFVVPLSVVLLFFELNTPRNVSVYQTGKLLLLGGAVGLIALFLFPRFPPVSGGGSLIPALLAGVLEETGKALVLLLVAGSARYRWQLNGLLLGAAVGAGFAGVESAESAFQLARTAGEGAGLITLRSLLSPGGHVIWTAMIGSAIWKQKGERPFTPAMLVAPVVLQRWGIAVLLHGLWETWIGPPSLRWAVLSVVGGYIVLRILAQGLNEVAAAKREVAGP